MDEAELLAACSQLSRRWLDRSRLLWAAWLLHGLPQRQVSPFLRAHHIGRVSAFGALLDLAAYMRAGPALDASADPKLRFTNNGVAVANLRVAVTACIQNREGPWRDGETSFHKVIVWRDQAVNLADSPRKGDQVMGYRPAAPALLGDPRGRPALGHRDRGR